MVIKKVDSQGRISLPAEWRKEVLGDSKEVCMFREGEFLVVRPKREPDLVRHFDSIAVDVEAETFGDYHRLKNALLREK
ncbi:MAG: MraZ N-terminal domain containing protein [Candidatus Brockarchaeota archaeon]|nr:MraZ N-terminal domain containing protein [Candidatus Brockarchaeota archaeon]